MNGLLILRILIISTAPLFAQTQQPNAAELAQKVVSVISGDKVKIQTYCQILDLSDELDQADQQKDRERMQVTVLALPGATSASAQRHLPPTYRA